MNSRCSKRLDSRLAAVGTKSKRFYVPISLLIKRARPCARVARVRPPGCYGSERPVPEANQRWCVNKHCSVLRQQVYI